MSNQLYRQIKLILALGLLVAIAALAVFILVASDSILSLWQRLEQGPDVLFYGYIAGFSLFAILSLLLLWRFFASPSPRQSTAVTREVMSQQQITDRVSQAASDGIDTLAAERELAELAQRKSVGQVYIAVFGDISMGKSALVKSLVAVQEIDVAVIGGTTREVRHYQWTSPSGDHLIFADVPGLNEAQGTLSMLAQEEAIRAHIVIYVCDGDLTQTQYYELDALLAMNKPLIVAINKTDRYSASDVEAIRARIAQRIGDRARAIVSIRSGGIQDIIRVDAEGREHVEERLVSPELGKLKEAIQNIIDHDPTMLDELRDANVFMLVAHKLEVSQLAHRRDHAQAVVKSYTRKAIVGSMAAVSPGTDLLIQGYLATSMLKELCAIYDAKVRKLDLEAFLELSQSHLGKTTPLLLAVAGNGLKAFPGVGTLVGGLVHAVAYGLIFDALGRSVVEALEQRGDLLPGPASALFKENLSGNLEARTKRFVQLALEIAREQKK